MPVYHAVGQAHAKSVPLVPVLQLMRNYFEISEQDSDQTARERIAGKLLLLGEGFVDVLPLMFDFLAVSDPERPSPRMDPEARQRQLLDITKRMIHAQSAREPGHQPVRGSPLARPRQRDLPRQPHRRDRGHGEPDDRQLPPGVPRRLDVEALLPPDRADPAG